MPSDPTGSYAIKYLVDNDDTPVFVIEFTSCDNVYILLSSNI